jgi:TonB family protein
MDATRTETGGAGNGGGARFPWRGRRRRPCLRVALLWRGTLVREETLPPGRDLSVGEGAACDLVVPGLPAPGTFLLARTGPEGTRLCLVPGLDGDLRLGGRDHAAADLRTLLPRDGTGAAEVAFGPGDWAMLGTADVQVFLSCLHPSSLPVARRFTVPDGVQAAAHVAAAFAVLAVVVGAQLSAGAAGGTEARPAERRTSRVDRVLTVPSALAVPDVEVLPVASEPGLRAGGEEGAFGERTRDPSRRPVVPHREGRLVTRFDPARMGLAGALGDRERRPAALSAVMEGDADRFANRLAVAASGAGAEYQPGFGQGGMGFRGTGPGGGGDSPYGRLQGLARWDGSGTGPGARVGLGPRKARSVGGFTMPPPTVSAFCRADDLRRVVLQRQAAIRACYEQELALRPDLQGKVVVRWTVGVDGRVDQVSVAESSVPVRAVESCVSRVIGNARFVAPVGGVCVVQWPFVFSPG